MSVQAHSKDVTISRAMLAQGRGWSVSDVTFRATSACSRFESRHEGIAIVAVTAGSFRYRSSHGSVTLMPGALMLGNAGDAFACDYDDTWGDRCVSFSYTPDYFERVAGGVTGARHARFHTHRVAATPGAIALTAEIETERGRADAEPVGRACVARRRRRAVGGRRCGAHGAERARRTARHRRARPDRGPLCRAAELGAIAGAVHMSPYHFLRVFRAVAGVTPHQYLVRTRLRHAAIALATTDQPIADIAFAHGFGDLSTFVTTFRRVFGAAPRAYRAAPRAALAAAHQVARMIAASASAFPVAAASAVLSKMHHAAGVTRSRIAARSRSGCVAGAIHPRRAVQAEVAQRRASRRHRGRRHHRRVGGHARDSVLRQQWLRRAA